ncbi:MAG: TldD/PmbA family protein [Deltaproteobacteria bacterium]|nr:TldD/PmbA family protein [Deltaproteobacteria bacterium]
MSRVPALVDDRTAAEGLAQALVDAARRTGAAACDATVGTSASLTVTARDGTVEEIGRSQSRAAALRVIVDGRLGFATASDAPTTPAEVDELVATAVGLARLATASPHNVVLPVVARSTDEWRAAGDALDTWDELTAHLDASWASAQALAMERIVRGHDGVTGVRDVSASCRRGVFALATSTGFVGALRGTSAALSCSAVVQDGPHKLQVETGWGAARALGRLPKPAEVADDAARRALARRGARRVSSTEVPVILDPSMSRAFFAGVLAVIGGEAVARRQSFLQDAVGRHVLPPGHTLIDDPLLPSGLASKPFDGEGQPTQRRVLVDDAGRLTGFLLDGRSAARLGAQSTGHASRGATSLPSPAPTNTTLLGGRGDLASIIASTKRGLLVTRALGRGADPTTGDLSRGVAGFWVEDGALAFPVEGITMAGNARQLLLSLDRVGADVDERSALRMPSVRFAAVALGGS